MNIYDGCIDSNEVFYRNYDTSWDEQLDSKRKYYEDQGYKVVFVFHANSFQDVARVVLHNKDTPISLHMQEFEGKYVRPSGHWVIERQLGICNVCGEYKKLCCREKRGMVCKDCEEDQEWQED